MQTKPHFAVGLIWPHVAALAAALILVASINFLWWRLYQEANNQVSLVDHGHEVLSTLDETLECADDMVIGQRGFALTHDTEYLKRYFDATNNAPGLLLSLRQLVSDNPKQIAAFDRLQPLFENYESMNRDHIAQLSKANALDPDLDFRHKIMDSMDKIHAAAGKMITEENNLLDERQEASERAAIIVKRVNIVAGLVSMALIIAVFIALGRENTRRRISEVELHRSHEQLEQRVRQRTLSLVQSEIERKRLEQEILETSDTEMHRIGHDLHDGVGQKLTALSLFATSLQNEAEAQAPQLADSCKKLSTELREAIREVRQISHGLSPVSPEDNGLADALRKLADDMRSANTECRFSDCSEICINDPHLAVQFYRIGQEAVTNAAKHSGARQIQIILKTNPSLKELTVTDNGCGFSPSNLNGDTGLGFRAMKYRADVIGAAIKIDSAPGKGTRITCSLQTPK